MPIEPASSIVHALKYGGWGEVADEMAERMSRLSWPEDVLEERAAIVPIPLASARKRERGYNQSELIARGLSRRWRIPVWDGAVVRSRETGSQTRLTPEQRQGNVAGSFQIWRGKPDSLEGRTSCSSMTSSPLRQRSTNAQRCCTAPARGSSVT